MGYNIPKYKLLTFSFDSAGVGRTGTFIALDYLLDQAKNENLVDVYKVVQRMRSKRVNMVQTQVSHFESTTSLCDTLH